ncbi:hypothetical protein TFGA2_00246 [Neisseria gonorrhoeae]|nr:hypothetical protein TFGA2_00246 [Neisseria gonorrhoeae]QBK53501.1 hypothetical protein TFGB2_00247 [Neisseria gonorrhoeae]CNQ30389.1 transposase [Neisseria gonorrhoeae]CNR23260.1 transposase [Neisseria gonorrhoeae]STZ70666.1 transposase [Neisseria gonorrhoeae]
MAYSADLRNKALNHSGLTKIRTRRRAAGSTNGTEPIRPALHYLREPFPLGRGGATPYRFLLIRYITDNAKTPVKPQQRLTCQETRFTCGFALKNKQAA